MRPKTVKVLKREALSLYDRFAKKAAEAIAQDAAIVVKMPLVLGYSQGMGRWSFSLQVLSTRGEVLVSPFNPIGGGDTGELRQVLGDAGDQISSEDRSCLKRVIEAIEQHDALFRDLDDCLGGSFTGDPLQLDHE